MPRPPHYAAKNRTALWKAGFKRSPHAYSAPYIRHPLPWKGHPIWSFKRIPGAFISADYSPALRTLHPGDKAAEYRTNNTGLCVFYQQDRISRHKPSCQSLQNAQIQHFSVKFPIWVLLRNLHGFETKKEWKNRSSRCCIMKDCV